VRREMERGKGDDDDTHTHTLQQLHSRVITERTRRHKDAARKGRRLVARCAIASGALLRPRRTTRRGDDKSDGCGNQLHVVEESAM
jgi:hypothetical protein